VSVFDGIFQASSYFFAFVVMIGVLIFVHELGHFLAAKACGIRVLKFSLGFGAPVGIGKFRLRWVRGHTEYVVCWIPLGGFVKMLGENLGLGEEEEDERITDADPSESMDAKPVWQKLIVVFAGPMMNLLLPVLIFTAILASGLPQPQSVIGEIEPGSPADSAGLQPGDRVTAVNGDSVKWWREIADATTQEAGGELTIRYERDAVEASVQVPVEKRTRPDVFGEPAPTGWIGAYHPRLRAVVGLADRDLAAYAAGLRSGDLVTSVGGQDVADWYEWSAAYAAAGSAGDVPLTLKRGREKPESLTVSVPALGDVAKLGLVRADVLIAQVVEGAPAAEAGLQSGDLIRRVNGAAINSFDTFSHIVRQSQGEPLSMSVARDGEEFEVSIAPKLVKTDPSGIGMKIPRYRIGIIGNNMVSVQGSIQVDQVFNPMIAVPRAVAMTVEITRVFLRGLGKLISGEVPRDQIAGPIGIAEIAGKSLERGWLDYLHTLVLISINLGILNLLPIPILDGGQALIFSIEGIRRAPLSIRTRGFVQQIGVTMLLLIMGLAFWNDISRNWTRVVGWFTEGL
jgi:regulator of sigma E protease